ncbi:MAG: succinate dehydrogenase assembly factor 2 [Alphaproteobacteria bacterium]|nr:succinate dehydrogenase assembly factor 2 [Alphaproteobacteria bacterium]
MPEAVPENNIDIMRKKLIFRSWHRGTREIDLLLGKFADAYISACSADELVQYDRFLNNSDPDIYNWITRVEPVPPAEDCDVVQALLGFYPQ